MKEVKFGRWTCRVLVGKYHNNTRRLDLWNNEDGPIATATINSGELLPANQAYIKDYSENEGMLKALMEAGIVEEVIGYAISGRVVIPLCKLNLE